MLPFLAYAILLHSTIGVLGEPYRSPEYPEIVDDEQNVISNPEWNPRGLLPGYVDSRESSSGYSGFVDGTNESPMMDNPGWDSQIVQPSNKPGSEVRSPEYSGIVDDEQNVISNPEWNPRGLPPGYVDSRESTAGYSVLDKDNQEKTVNNLPKLNWPDVIDDNPPPEDSPPEVTVRVVLDKKSLDPDLVPNLLPWRYFENLDPKLPTRLNGQYHYMRGFKYTTNRLLDYGRVASLGWNAPAISALIEFKNFSGYISCIQIFNLKQSHETGARVYFEKGGVGNNFVTIRFEGFPFHHFDYFVKIFG